MKRMNLPLCAAVAAALVVLPACIIHVDADGIDAGTFWDDDLHHSVRRGSGHSATETRTVAEFTGIELRGCADVRARIGSERSVAVTTDDNLLQHVRTEVQGGKLVISMEPGRYSFQSGLTLDITTPALDSLSISGSGDVRLSELDGAKLSIAISGSGDVHAAGRVDALDVAITGSGDVDLSALKANRARAQISGSGDILLDVAERLDATITGSGDLRYTGSPEVRSQVSGSGSVSRR